MFALIEPAQIRVISMGRLCRLCRRPYRGHPRGCPNYGKKFGCPPKSRLLKKIIDLSRDIYVIWTVFQVGQHAERMFARYPNWSPRQLFNPRQWQPKARKAHRLDIEEFLKEHRDFKVIWPEAHGVIVSSIMEPLGIRLNWEWPPPSFDAVTYIISLAGLPVK